MNRQGERLVDGNDFEIRNQVSIRRHRAEQFLRNLRHVDRSVDFSDIFAELGPFQTDQMVHVDVGDEEHRARVVVRLERVDGNQWILFQDAVVRAHDCDWVVCSAGGEEFQRLEIIQLMEMKPRMIDVSDRERRRELAEAAFLSTLLSSLWL